VGPQVAIFWVVLVAGQSPEADVLWADGGPAWSSPSAAGKVIDATPPAALGSPRAAARLAAPQPAPSPPPKQLPTLADPVLTPTVPAAKLRVTLPTPAPLPPPRPASVSPPATVEPTHTRTTPIVVAEGRHGTTMTYRPSAGAKAAANPAARLTAPTR
jgi:hypothetical protein